MSAGITIMSQGHMEALSDFGANVFADLAAMLCGLEGYAAASKLERDRWMGRELGIALFLAARGEATVNRISLIEGFSRAIGEAISQQADTASAQVIMDAVVKGVADGQSFAREAFPQAGQA